MLSFTAFMFCLKASNRAYCCTNAFSRQRRGLYAVQAARSDAAEIMGGYIKEQIKEQEDTDPERWASKGQYLDCKDLLTRAT